MTTQITANEKTHTKTDLYSGDVLFFIPVRFFLSIIDSLLRTPLLVITTCGKKSREKSRECHNHKPQPFPDTKKFNEIIKLHPVEHL